MKNSIGNHLTISLFGESHGEEIGVVIDGLAPGIHLDMDFIQGMMEKRKAKGRISTQRKEADELHIVSGFFQGYTTGTPLTILIHNTNTQSKDYEKTKNRLRPSHADYTADVKYLGYQDYRGGGHFSGRLTAPLVAAGAIAMQILNEKGIQIATHIQKCNRIEEARFSNDEDTLLKEIAMVNERAFPIINEEKGKEMIALIEEAANDGDSVGGILESVIINMPAGIGEPMFDSIESRLSHLLFAVPAIKGVEFGLGFGFSDLYGSEANDAIYYDGSVKTKTNHNGGINGGISNAMPITIRTVVKPTPSIYKQQDTIDKETHEAVKLNIEGRHDPAIIHRARVVVDSVLALGILDLMMEREATLSMRQK
ncbi:chorismate synthase [[Eubacterium] hominis]|uniref:chorismate synthase n=1 Tax=[Eubacterium] hominis TaxID=2764325 RepID=UPI003A4D44C5